MKLSSGPCLVFKARSLLLVFSQVFTGNELWQMFPYVGEAVADKARLKPHDDLTSHRTTHTRHSRQLHMNTLWNPNLWLPLGQNWKWSHLIGPELKMEPSDWSRLQTPVTVLRTLSPAPVINKVQIRFHQNLRTCGLHILHIVLLTKKWFYQGFVEVHEGLTWDVTNWWEWWRKESERQRWCNADNFVMAATAAQRNLSK